MIVLDRSGSVRNCYWYDAASQYDCDFNTEMIHNEIYYFAREIIAGFELGEGSTQFGIVDFDADAREIVSTLTSDASTLAAGLELCEDDATCRADYPEWADTAETIREYEQKGPLAVDQRANGWTSISNGLALGRELLVRGNTRKDAVTGASPKRIMLLLTDGQQTCTRDNPAKAAWTYSDGGRWDGDQTCSAAIADNGTGDDEAIEQASVLKASSQNGGDDVTIFAVGFGTARQSTIESIATSTEMSYFSDGISGYEAGAAAAALPGDTPIAVSAAITRTAAAAAFAFATAALAKPAAANASTLAAAALAKTASTFSTTSIPVSATALTVSAATFATHSTAISPTAIFATTFPASAITITTTIP
eukprot:scaffold209822_cov26-Tisochrysis_lutea.AAC.1